MAKKRVNLDILLEEWCKPENWDKNLKEMCELLGWNYSSVAKKISDKYGMPEFRKIRDKKIKEALNEMKGIAYKSLLEKIKSGNLKALEMYFKMTGELTDRVELSGNVSIAMITKRKIIRKEDK